jgi:hypothetical protein
VEDGARNQEIGFKVVMFAKGTSDEGDEAPADL